MDLARTFVNRDVLFARLDELNGQPAASVTQMGQQNISLRLANALKKADIPSDPHRNLLNKLPYYILEALMSDVFRDHFASRGEFSLHGLAENEVDYMRRKGFFDDLEPILIAIVPDLAFAEYVWQAWNAEYLILDKAADRFTRAVWQKGLCELARSRRSLGASFGRTHISTHEFLQAVLIKFRRGKETAYLGGIDGDRDWVRPEITQEASLSCALEMIEEVIALWPEDVGEHKKRFGIRDQLANKR